jgi:hypothetical protein
VLTLVVLYCHGRTLSVTPFALRVLVTLVTHMMRCLPWPTTRFVKLTRSNLSTDFRHAIDAKLREVFYTLPDTLLVEWFAQGVSAGLYAHCVVSPAASYPQSRT